MGFLPISKAETNGKQLDFICITGDAYVDHPSFGIAVISRFIESLGFSVGIVAQPVSDSDYLEFGKPKYAFLITGGNIDSMVSNYTVSGKKRYDDAYSAGGKGGKRPDRALTVYSKNVKRLFPDIIVIIGGLEASLRRFAHYDYWENRVMPSVLVDSNADLLVYGMGELAIAEIALGIKNLGGKLPDISDIKGICYLTEPKNTPLGAVQCDSFELVRDNKKCYASSCVKQYDEQDEVYGRTIIQRHGVQMLVQNPPRRTLTESEMDKVYELPYMRDYHPIYKALGGVPAIEEVQFSLTHNRGCFGFCNFCSIALHQGRRIQTRSEDSLAYEAEKLTEMPNFKGYIHDVGGPTANFRKPSCKKQLEQGLCKGKKCHSCPNLEVSHEDYLRVLKRLRSIKKVKKVFIRSGIRFDYVMRDKNDEFLHELVLHHTSGQLKIAPEHSSGKVLDLMGKPHIDMYERFKNKFYGETKKCGLEQYLVPYFMSSHPGATLSDAVELAIFLKKNNVRPEQVQDFYPTPGTISTAMFYTGINPYTGETVYVPKNPEEKKLQRALLQYYKPENMEFVRKALIMTKNKHLIGDDEKCLVPNATVKKTGGSHAKKTLHQVQQHSAKKQKSSQKSGKGLRGKKLGNKR